MCRYIWKRFNLKIQIEMKKIFLFLSFMVFIGSNAQIFDALKDLAKKKVTEKATNLVGENVKNAVTKEAITPILRIATRKISNHRNLHRRKISKRFAVLTLRRRVMS